MLETLRGVLPDMDIRRDQIVHVFCGVRSLPASGSKVTAVVSRGHSIQTNEPDADRPFAVMSLVGGKWTTFRALAAQAGDAVLARLGRERKTGTDDMPIGGGRDCPTDDQQRKQWVARVAGETSLPEPRHRNTGLLPRDVMPAPKQPTTPVAPAEMSNCLRVSFIGHLPTRC